MSQRPAVPLPVLETPPAPVAAAAETPETEEALIETALLESTIEGPTIPSR